MFRSRFTRWDGSQRIQLTPSQVFEKLSEYLSFFLNLTLATAQPVVVVGAQRPASALGTDAGMNLVNALRVAGSPDAKGKGVLVVLNDEIHAARDVVKTSTYRLQTFRSLDFGALGHADGDGVHFYRAPLRAHMPDTPFAASDPTALPRVDIVYSYAGADGALVDAAVAAGARGIVSAGFAKPAIAGSSRAVRWISARSSIQSLGPMSVLPTWRKVTGSGSATSRVSGKRSSNASQVSFCPKSG